MMIQSLRWTGGVDGCLEIIDQRKLPDELVKLQCTDVRQLYDAIKTLAVRGAPAIGVAAAYGLVLSMQESRAQEDLATALASLNENCMYLSGVRPTAVNLSGALQRVRAGAEEFVRQRPGAGAGEFREFVLEQANTIFQEDAAMCRRIGENGWQLVTEGVGILTHCNAGALATAGQGTALSVLYEAHNRGRQFKVYACESRPLLQGARLTAWELQQAGIDVTVICDDMAAYLMKQGRVDMVITGADRIAANGDTANKIGTYGLSILAARHKLDFYVAAPTSTFDLSIKSGQEIPIEERPAQEIQFCGDKRIITEGVEVWNPAFDVTNAEDITAIITDKGIIKKPNAEKIAAHLRCKV
ncbi:MAG TPA: S-methyl-5-thioribose-1-phosphate isomerase [Sedimentisphaerales bacterium]|nr:S-methyl-5-thioribose-1-phosphate isomerase [Sedimentisphaerales bacterium]